MGWRSRHRLYHDEAKLHDAVIATTCIQHRVDELWTADRDFKRFDGITVHNPLA